MTTLTQKDIAYIAGLAKLLPMEDTDKQCRDFNNLLSLFDTIAAVDTEGIEPLAHPIEAMSQLLRKDSVTETDQHALFQANAPAIGETPDGGRVYLVPEAIKSHNE